MPISLTFPELQSFASDLLVIASKLPYQKRLSLYRRAINDLFDIVRTNTVPVSVAGNQDIVLADQICRIRRAWNDDVTAQNK